MPDRKPKCPTCKNSVERQGNDYFPFCTERCQLQDLGKWLNNAYTIPGSSPDGLHDILPDSEEEPFQ